MAYTRTMTELETEIRYRADIGSATARHSQSQVFALIRSSLQSLRALLTDAGSKRFVCPLTIAQDGYSDDIPGAIGVPFADGVNPAFAIKTVESVNLVRVMWSGSWRELRRVSLPELVEVGTRSAAGAMPEVWCDAGSESVGRVATSVPIRYLYLAPWFGGHAADALPTQDILALGTYGLGALTLGADEVDLEQYGYEWLVADVGLKIATRDNDAQERAQLLMAARQDAERRMLSTIARETTPSVQRTKVTGLYHRRDRSWL